MMRHILSDRFVIIMFVINLSKGGYLESKPKLQLNPNGGGSDKSNERFKQTFKSSGETIARRLALIIATLMQGEAVNLRQLASITGVCERTIQRDLNDRLSFLQLIRNGNIYRLAKTPRQTRELDEFANSMGLTGLFPDKEVNCDNVSINLANIERLDQQPFATIRTALSKNQMLRFNYSGKAREVAPYSLRNLKGVWYLIATEGNVIKNYTLGKIRSATPTSHFTPKPAIIAKIKQQNGFVGEPTKVCLFVSSAVSEYVLRREIFPAQKIIQHHIDGSLTIECEMSFERGFMGLVRYWLPHVRILSPSTLRDQILTELEVYLQDEKKFIES